MTFDNLTIPKILEMKAESIKRKKMFVEKKKTKYR
jgi:hypothetical protein